MSFALRSAAIARLILDESLLLHCTRQCKRLSAFPTAREAFVNSFPSPEKFLFCTDKIEPIEWQDLVPRLRIGDCFEIHLPR